MDALAFFVTLVMQIVGLRLSRSDKEAQLTVDYLMALSLTSVWCLAFWLCMARTKKISYAFWMCIAGCIGGASFGFYQVLSVFRGNPFGVGGQVIEIIVGSFVCLFYYGVLASAISTVFSAIDNLINHSKGQNPPLPIVNREVSLTSSTDPIIPFYPFSTIPSSSSSTIPSSSSSIIPTSTIPSSSSLSIPSSSSTSFSFSSLDPPPRQNIYSWPNIGNDLPYSSSFPTPTVPFPTPIREIPPWRPPPRASTTPSHNELRRRRVLADRQSRRSGSLDLGLDSLDLRLEISRWKIRSELRKRPSLQKF